MKKAELYAAVIDFFERTQPPVETELHYETPFDLLVAVMLSAQCTDKRINMVTPRLLGDFPNAEAMAATSSDVIFDYIRSVSYPNSKAKHLVDMAKMLQERFNGQVPSTLEELTQLPGVGRKTANVIQAIAFGKEALAVDTHVFRVSHRLGLVPERCNTPLSVELEVTKHLPKDKISAAHFWLIHHGRYVCIARSPKCEECGLKMLCAYYKRQNAARSITVKPLSKTNKAKNKS